MNLLYCLFLCFILTVQYMCQANGVNPEKVLLDAGVDVSKMSYFVENIHREDAVFDAATYIKLKVDKKDISGLVAQLKSLPPISLSSTGETFPEWWTPSASADEIVYTPSSTSSRAVRVFIDENDNGATVYMASFFRF